MKNIPLYQDAFRRRFSCMNYTVMNIYTWLCVVVFVINLLLPFVIPFYIYPQHFFILDDKYN